MNLAAIVIGIILMIMGGIFTFVTLGFGLLCSWPVILIGLILFIVGLIVPSNRTTIIQQSSVSTPQTQKPVRNCPGCGKAIPDDAYMCPYCGKDLTFSPQYLQTSKKETTAPNETIKKKGTKFCKNCGEQLDDEDKYCTNCGEKVR